VFLALQLQKKRTAKSGDGGRKEEDKHPGAKCDSPERKLSNIYTDEKSRLVFSVTGIQDLYGWKN
jgi:hypothetical protein